MSQLKGFFSWPNASVNQNLQEIALRGLLDWFVMLIFYTEGVQCFVQLVWKAVDNCYDVKNKLLGEQYQLLGEYVDFHIQVLMVVFGEGEYIADRGVFLSSHAISPQLV